MVSTNDIRPGQSLIIEGSIYLILEYQHVKPGKGNQFTRTKMRNLITGNNLERTFRSGEKFEIPDVESKDANFLYKDEAGFHFMDQVNYEQFDVDKDIVGENSNFLTENLLTSLMFFNGRIIGIEVPSSVQLLVTQTDPGLKGNTVSNTTKPATLETGHIVNVPLHISEGDLLKVDTKSGDYVERINQK